MARQLLQDCRLSLDFVIATVYMYVWPPPLLSHDEKRLGDASAFPCFREFEFAYFVEALRVGEGRGREKRERTIRVMYDLFAKVPPDTTPHAVVRTICTRAPDDRLQRPDRISAQSAEEEKSFLRLRANNKANCGIRDTDREQVSETSCRHRQKTTAATSSLASIRQPEEIKVIKAGNKRCLL